MTPSDGAETDLARRRAHYRTDTGWLHCAHEYRERIVRTPSGPVAEMRCAHWTDPLRYDRIDPGEMRRIEAAEAERAARLADG